MRAVFGVVEPGPAAMDTGIARLILELVSDSFSGLKLVLL